MSVRTEIDRIIAAVSAAHEKVLSKGGTTAQPYLVENLATAIDTIPEGTSEDLTALLDAQETKLNTLLSTLDGKAAGGGGASVETCTLRIVSGGSSRWLYRYFVPTYENSVFGAAYKIDGSDLEDFDITITGVICGCDFMIEGYYTDDSVIPENVTLVSRSYDYRVYKLNASAGETVTLELHGDD